MSLHSNPSVLLAERRLAESNRWNRPERQVPVNRFECRLPSLRVDPHEKGEGLPRGPRP